MCRGTQQRRLYKPFCFPKTGAKWNLRLQFEKVLLNMPDTVCANEFAPSAHAAAHCNALFTHGKAAEDATRDFTRTCGCGARGIQTL